MPETSGGKQNAITFERVIVWPDGHREVEGVTPKQLPKPQQNSMPPLPEVVIERPGSTRSLTGAGLKGGRPPTHAFVR